ncbi:glycosyltransferase, partial [Candidatus Microgenomates bacterium]|nr:glycosyltransferase [Candidatus Microgenomates bacterium]
HNGKKYVPHNQLHPHHTAFQRVVFHQAFYMIVGVAILIAALVLNWHFTIVVFIAILTILYFADLLFNLFLIYRSFSKAPEIIVSYKEIQAENALHAWPTYSILCPLYKEWDVLPQFISSINGLDYPKDKLQVMLLLEEDDSETIEKARGYDLPPYFEIVIVPHSYPKTKPKACNYALTLARGEYTVIYDAEDVPDPRQLKKAVLAFRKAGPRTICIQAKLNFYNPHQNILTRVFTAEYSLWFDLVLTGLQSVHAPIPLGGTSNHFKTKDLHKLKGWDSFNVTEDCDLGIRLVKHGYRTAIIDSTTLEEANSDMKNWFWQRTRWIKGYMQTYLVHMRDPREFINDYREPHFLTFQLVVGGKILSMFINPLMWVITILYFALRPALGTFIESFFPAAILYMALFALVFGNFLYLYYYMVGCVKRGHDELVKYIFLIPLYWLAMSVAAWVALYRLIVAPHHWSKTKHGLHLGHKKSVNQAQKAIGKDLVDKQFVGA